MAGGVFRLLGRQAAIGRTLIESDVSTETQNPVVISDRLWRTRFAADPNVLGRTLTLDQATLVVVGVMPPDFHFPARGTDFWRALRFNSAGGDDDRGNHYLQVMARLKPGVTLRAGAIGNAAHRRSDRAAVSQGTGRHERRTCCAGATKSDGSRG